MAIRGDELVPGDTIYFCQGNAVPTTKLIVAVFTDPAIYHNNPDARIIVHLEKGQLMRALIFGDRKYKVVKEHRL